MVQKTISELKKLNPIDLSSDVIVEKVRFMFINLNVSSGRAIFAEHLVRIFLSEIWYSWIFNYGEAERKYSTYYSWDESQNLQHQKSSWRGIL